MKRRLAKLDAAFSYSLNRIYGKRTGGEDAHVWVRATACRRKIRGKWLITHEHMRDILQALGLPARGK